MLGLPNAQKLALLVNLPALRARRELERRGPEMTADQLFDFVLRATGSQAVAEAAHTARLRAQMDQGRDR